MTTTYYDEQKRVASSPVLNLLLRLLSSNWTWGHLTICLPDGTVHQLEGRVEGHAAVLRIRDARFARRVLKSGDIGFAEGYIEGEWDSPNLPVLLETLVNNYDHIRRLFDGNVLMQAFNWLVHRFNRNSRSGSRRNIHAHYDLGNEFYSAWLDSSMTYSSARYSREGLSLQDAQKEKYASLARVMDLNAGQTVLEIGCGWGGFAEYAAREVGAKVTGITISQEQYDFARRRIFEAGLSERADIQLIDYRDVDGRFDRVASIEMFEAVGREYWPVYFQKIHQVLKPEGRAGLQIITIQDDLFEDYQARTDFIQKYVFPGGTLPSEHVLASVIQQSGFHQDEVLRFGRDYADTLSEWSKRFESSWRMIEASNPKFDQRFRRLWLFYLAYCEAGFRSARTDVIQVGLSAR
ncbi:cyclopropane-fatty-acyl-phospholipid synthase family protein [Brevundimonas terrae]|uniref:Cyclopropane-fatty-acyl-phospholipid synthase family protein n=1 Tax=Brevundimonas terrae TaxID=363631 RepID=A0ABN0YJQ6_9CAUL|nr:cyclopropane-fatty-acyl-phospholipid synthase family protein [Brevundimonas terrae]NIJ27466.1 cyclopropane-fatty-acyl-phospholipid synthase [Brevundimonas terrae]